MDEDFEANGVVANFGTNCRCPDVEARTMFASEIAAGYNGSQHIISPAAVDGYNDDGG